ncbi:uncharacterized protein TNIN_23061 [Trichonephila inaurata madagascariensis]|uniref:Uncharacterized protein n=1 Tax=Trichonephila inaurata madagascariensis TaxID=2747483 RepID=A0A8X6Y0Q3_9ARAC|nr:uncharacterized protein TNIN_23061 [Trichonephila inaurata madagascariensis]
MTFLRKEVESEEMILARTGLGSTQRQIIKATAEEPSLATSAALINTNGEEIAEISSPEDWKHVPGRMNPTDVLSCGCSPRPLLESKWFRGPDRPLAYVSEDSEDLIPLTPAMFMMSNSCLDVTDLDLRDFAKFQKRVKFRARLLKDLRGRFREEYLGLLVQKAHKTTRALKVGEIVLIENPNNK